MGKTQFCFNKFISQKLMLELLNLSKENTSLKLLLKIKKNRAAEKNIILYTISAYFEPDG